MLYSILFRGYGLNALGLPKRILNHMQGTMRWKVAETDSFWHLTYNYYQRSRTMKKYFIILSFFLFASCVSYAETQITVHVVYCSGSDGVCVTLISGNNIELDIPGTMTDLHICIGCGVESISCDTCGHAVWVNTSSTTGVGYVGNGVYAPHQTTSDSTDFYLDTNTSTYGTFTSKSAWDAAVSSFYGKAIEHRDDVGVLTSNDISLSQNYPNPFSGNTIITYAVLNEDLYGNNVKITLTDMQGNEVAEIYNGIADGSKHVIAYNSAQLPSGHYYYSVLCGNKAAHKLLEINK